MVVWISSRVGDFPREFIAGFLEAKSASPAGVIGLPVDDVDPASGTGKLKLSGRSEISSSGWGWLK